MFLCCLYLSRKYALAIPNQLLMVTTLSVSVDLLYDKIIIVINNIIIIVIIMYCYFKF